MNPARTLQLPVSVRVLQGYSGTAGDVQQKIIKHSGESPSVTFIILAKKKKIVMMCLFRHGTGQQGVLYFKQRQEVSNRSPLQSN